MAGGVRTAHGVPPSAMGSDQPSSVGHSRGVDRAIDSPLVGAAPVAAMVDRLTNGAQSIQTNVFESFLLIEFQAAYTRTHKHDAVLGKGPMPC